MKYSEFSDPCLVAIYDTVNPIAEYRAFYIELAAKLAGARQVSSIVDIGCGSGQLTCELAKQGHHLIGVEPSSAMLNLARRRAATDLVAAELTAAGVGAAADFGAAVDVGADAGISANESLSSAHLGSAQVEWIHGGAQSLGQFDADLAIMTGHVAQFFLEDEIWHGALASIYKALKPGGYLVFESRNPIVQPFLMASRQTADQESVHGSDRESDHVDWPSETNRRRVIDPVAGAVEWWFQLLSVEGDRVLYEIHYLFEKTGEKAISTNELRFRTRGELEANLVAAGFTVECVYGNWDFQLAEADSPEFIFVAKRS